MNAKQRRVQRRKIARMNESERFVNWVRGGPGPVMYCLHDDGMSGNPVYWAQRAGTTTKSFNLNHLYLLLGVEHKPDPAVSGRKKEV